MSNEQYQDILAACMRKAGAEKEQEDREEAERAAGGRRGSFGRLSRGRRGFLTKQSKSKERMPAMQGTKKKTLPRITEAEAKITELEIENARLKNDLVCARRAHESLQNIHFEQTERITRELGEARRALEAVAQHCLPSTTPLSYIAQLPGAAPAWKRAAAVLYGDGYANNS
jgi:hypothetical protein